MTRISVPTLSLFTLSLTSPLFALSPEAVARTSPATKLERADASLTGLLGPSTNGWETRTDAKSGQITVLLGGRTQPMGKDPEEAARAFLSSGSRFFLRKKQSEDLKTSGTCSSPVGYHVSFVQRVKGIPVYNGYVRVHMSPKMEVRMVTNHSQLVKDDVSTEAKVSPEDARQIAQNSLGATELRGRGDVELNIRQADGEGQLVYKVSVPSRAPLGDFQVLVNAVTGKVVASANLMKHGDPTATAKVFNPNPCVTLKNFKLKNENNSATSIPEEAYQTVQLQGLDGSGKLRGKYVDVSGTTGGAAQEASGAFNYNRADQRFEQVMVYHHIDRAQRYIQSLGFNNIQNRQQVVNAHGTQDDNSWYSPMTKELTFGDGGVHDAQDADIIMHEYGHAIQDNQVPGFGATEEGGSMGEGFGDYLAGSLRADHAFHDLAVGMWDATAYSQAEPPALRRLDSSKHYPDGMQGEVHADGEIWSACLRQIWDKLGAKDCDKLVLQSHFFLHSDAQFADGVDALLQADRMLFNGSHVDTIKKIFEDRGILKVGGSARPASTIASVE